MRSTVPHRTTARTAAERMRGLGFGGAALLGPLAACAAVVGLEDRSLLSPDAPDVQDAAEASPPELDAADGGGPLCDRTKPFTAIEEVSELNASGDGAVLGDSFARLTEDQLRVYFGRVTDTFRILSASRTSKDAKFGVPTEVGLNKPPAEFDAFPLPVGNKLYIQRTTGASLGPRDIVVAEAVGSGFSPAQPVPGLSDPELSERSPWLAADGAMWVGIEILDGGMRRRVARAAPLGGGAFDKPVVVDLGSAADADDGEPVLTADGLLLFFGSNRIPDPPPPIPTRKNIWSTTRKSVSDPWEPAEPSLALNSAEDDEPTWISPDGCELWFQSYRPGGYRIYRARR